MKTVYVIMPQTDHEGYRAPVRAYSSKAFAEMDLALLLTHGKEDHYEIHEVAIIVGEVE